ncbi:hypothetical protein V6N13_060086 [Hibiscus sabdariffa]|uniref:Alliinase C-terminal domain-containing protein n=1 Tax=Hibiscus sabdariffa TaxID=183260 RepID=A0ABR2GB68_9ROSI
MSPQARYKHTPDHPGRKEYRYDGPTSREAAKYIEINTIGVSDNSARPNAGASFFKFSYHVMAKRWKQLREAVHESGLFSVPDFPPQLCKFLDVVFEPQPGKRRAKQW